MPDLIPRVPLPEEQQTLPPRRDGDVPSPLPGSDWVGRRFGKYELTAELGRGGMGIVFKANQTDLQRTVAIKMILCGAVAGSEDLQRFRGEAEATASLHHSNIVHIHEVGEIDGLPYFSMEYIEGHSLAQRLSEGPLRSKAAAQYVSALARAIQHAHEHNILHRDLKPSNVLLDREDRPHITDFGLAKRLNADSGQTRTGAVLGTPGYMAPEQAAGSKQLTPAVDVYGLGAILYELLTGRPPFRAESPLDTVLQVLDRDPAPPRLLNPNVDRDLETICLKCLEKDPRRRYGSAKALAEDLERYLAGESIRARSLNLVSRIVSTLEHSHYDLLFQAYGKILFGFALIMLLAETAKFLAFHTHQTWFVVSLIELARFGSVASILLWLRPAGLQTTNTAERLMWTVWIGYVITLFVVGLTHWILVGGWLVEQEFKLYPPIAAVTGMAFFILGCRYWGWCYAIGLAFHALALLMTIDLRWAPLEFGTLWAGALLTIGMRLRRLGKVEQPSGHPSEIQASQSTGNDVAATGEGDEG
jgi:serine/threonine-protein kinase